MSEDWGELVKRYRLRHGLTQGRMATVIGVSQRTVLAPAGAVLGYRAVAMDEVV